MAALGMSHIRHNSRSFCLLLTYFFAFLISRYSLHFIFSNFSALSLSLSPSLPPSLSFSHNFERVGSGDGGGAYSK